MSDQKAPRSSLPDDDKKRGKQNDEKRPKFMALLDKLTEAEEQAKKAKKLAWKPPATRERKNSAEAAQERMIMATVPGLPPRTKDGKEDGRNVKIMQQFKKLADQQEQQRSRGMTDKAKVRSKSEDPKKPSDRKVSNQNMERLKSRHSITHQNARNQVNPLDQPEEYQLQPQAQAQDTTEENPKVTTNEQTTTDVQTSFSSLEESNPIPLQGSFPSDSVTVYKSSGDHTFSSSKETKDTKTKTKSKTAAQEKEEESAVQQRSPEEIITSQDGGQSEFPPKSDQPGANHAESVSGGEKSKKKNQKVKKVLGARTIMNDYRKSKVNERQNLQKLTEDFGIPDQHKLLETLLEEDYYMHNFNGFVREYYSHVLRSYCVMNMQERYRGLDPNSPCLKIIDLGKLTSKDAFRQKREEEIMRERLEFINKLKDVAFDTLHFKFLRELARTQPLTLPISIMYGILSETKPAVENVWRFYISHLGKNHRYSKQAGQHYCHLERRHRMYKNLGFGDETHVNNPS